MNIEVNELFPDQPVTQQGARPSLELVELVQQMRLAIEDLQARVTALEP